MEFLINLNVTSNELFRALNNTIIEDVFAFTGKKLKNEDIKKGFKYEKDVNMNKSHPKIAKVDVLEYKEGNTFTIQYSSSQKKSIVTYKIESESCNKVCLDYKENLFLNRKDDKGIYRFVEVPCEKVEKVPFLKKIQFHSLEKEIIKRRGEK